MKLNRKNLNDTSVELTIELSADELQRYVLEAQQYLASMLKLDGFRPGHVPLEVALKHIPEAHVREEALQRAIRGTLLEAIAQEGIRIQAQEDFAIIENTPEKLSYRIRVRIRPTVALGAYKGLRITRKPVEVTDQEIDTTIEQIKNLPPESIKNFETPEQMQHSVREGLMMEKELREDDRMHVTLLEQIIATSTFSARDLPAEMKMMLVTEAIAEAEGLHIEEEELEDHVQLYLQRSDRNNINVDALRDNIRSLLISKRVFEFLKSNAIIDPQ